MLFILNIKEKIKMKTQLVAMLNCVEGLHEGNISSSSDLYFPVDLKPLVDVFFSEMDMHLDDANRSVIVPLKSHLDGDYFSAEIEAKDMGTCVQLDSGIIVHPSIAEMAGLSSKPYTPPKETMSVQMKSWKMFQDEK